MPSASRRSPPPWRCPTARCASSLSDSYPTISAQTARQHDPPRSDSAKEGRRRAWQGDLLQVAGLQCATCHRIAGVGSTLGPDLSDIGKKYSRAQILESILDPSKFIEPKYVTYLAETTDGKLYTGLLAAKTDKEVVLKMAGDKEVRLPASKVESLVPQQKSLMPELLLRDVTLEQAADLLEFLATRKVERNSFRSTSRTVGGRFR